jgi:glyoxylase-like metal-dependent hydrolase (beta-lactamase superfamily II)
MKKLVWLALIVLAIPAYSQRNFDTVEVKVAPVQGNIYVLTGTGGNTTVQVGSDGVLVVDTMFAPLGPKILAAIRTITDKPVRYILNTHVHVDHAGANEPVLKASPGAKILAHENVLKVMSAKPTGKPNDPHDRFIQAQGAWPTETYKTTKSFSFNGETIDLYHQPNAHSDGDSIIHFRGSNVIVGGDIFAVSRFSSYDTDGGGSLAGMLAGLNRMVALATPQTKVVPGHGPVATREQLVAYRDMSVDIRNQVQALVNKGMTLEQVKAARPTAKYEPPYGGPNGNTDNVLGDIYSDLSKKK